MGKTSIARIAVTAGLSLAAMTSMMPVVPAMAAVSYGTGSIVINKVDGNGTVTYDGYQIFKANVADDATSTNTTGKTETNVAWANDDVKTAVEDLISKDANYAGKTAEDAATYISGKITSTDNTTRVDAASFANKLAKAVDGKTSTTSVTPGTAATLDEGYWLFVTNTATDSKTDTVGTAPIFAVVGGTTQVTVTEKTTVPTVSKQVKNDATGADFTSVADAEAGQSVTYELTGTVADNVATYDTYKYAFSDVLSTGLVANEDSVKVSIGGKEIAADSYTKHYDTGTNTLSVSFADLKAAKGTDGSTVTLTSSSKVVVDYTASLDPTKAIVLGGEGNANTVTLTYSNNPHSDGTGKTTPKTAKLFSYKLQLHKIDRTTETNLQGAKFTIQATGDDDGSSTKYVQSDGTLGDTAYEFETDKDGNINVTGLDAGTYTVTETVAPAGYDKVDSFTFQIKPTYDDDAQTLTKLENVLTATDSVIAGDTDGVVTDNVLTASGKNAADTSTGTVKITVGDVKRVTMPLTGMDGVTFTWIAGGAILAIGLANIIRTKRHADGAAE